MPLVLPFRMMYLLINTKKKYKKKYTLKKYLSGYFLCTKNKRTLLLISFLRVRLTELLLLHNFT